MTSRKTSPKIEALRGIVKLQWGRDDDVAEDTNAARQTWRDLQSFNGAATMTSRKTNNL